MLTLLLALPVIAAGVVAWWAMQHRSPDGSFRADLAPIDAPSRIVVVPDVDAVLHRDAPIARAERTELLLTAPAGSFVGMASPADLAGYLTGVGYTEITGARLGRGPLTVQARQIAADSVSVADPDEQSFWVRNAHSALRWTPAEDRDRQMALIIIAPAGVDPIPLAVSVSAGWLGSTTWGLLILGPVLLLLGLAALAWPQRPREIVYVIDPSSAAHAGLPAPWPLAAIPAQTAPHRQQPIAALPAQSPARTSHGNPSAAHAIAHFSAADPMAGSTADRMAAASPSAADMTTPAHPFAADRMAAADNLAVADMMAAGGNRSAAEAIAAGGNVSAAAAMAARREVSATDVAAGPVNHSAADPAVSALDTQRPLAFGADREVWHELPPRTEQVDLPVAGRRPAYSAATSTAATGLVASAAASGPGPAAAGLSWPPAEFEDRTEPVREVPTQEMPLVGAGRPLPTEGVRLHLTR